jgi:small GTP-binding protein
VTKKKICMVGMYGVGKTSLVRRFVESIYEDRYHTTIGVKIDKKSLTVNGEDVVLAIWDMAGEDEMAQARLSHLRGADGYILVADGTRGASLEKAVDLQRRIGEIAGSLPFVLAVNKNDMREEWEVREEDLAALEWPVYRSSARSGEGVEELFGTLAERMLSRRAVAAVDDDDGD